MELFGSGIISSKALHIERLFSLRSTSQRKGDLRGVVRMGRKAAVLGSKGFKEPTDLTSDPREGGF